MITRKRVMPAFNFDERKKEVRIETPEAFSFSETLTYLTRSSLECLHHVESGKVTKLIEVDGLPYIIEVSEQDDALRIRFPYEEPDKKVHEYATDYVIEWFDLRTDLDAFYKLAETDPLLVNLTTDHYGLRIVGVPQLFEALCWAIAGQQVNLTFAYTLKRRFVESFGKGVEWNGHTYWLFPKPEDIAALKVNDLRALQFTGKKAEYTVAISELMVNGDLSKEALLSMDDFEAVERRLVSIRGIGPWTANYVLMRCLRDPSAFPIGDVGLHNALKKQLGRDQKPPLEEIQEIFEPWKGWEAYAVFYLWQSLASYKK